MGWKEWLGTYERSKLFTLSGLLNFDLSRPSRQVEKEDKAADAEEGGKKKKGGIQVPEEWPWQEAKKLFEKPDVLPASEVEVDPTSFMCATRPRCNLTARMEGP